jgi:hypothetical protein
MKRVFKELNSILYMGGVGKWDILTNPYGTVAMVDTSPTKYLPGRIIHLIPTRLAKLRTYEELACHDHSKYFPTKDEYERAVTILQLFGGYTEEES